MVADEISGFVKSAAVEEGFDLVGVAEAKRLKTESERLTQWLSRGYHATMNWMSRDVEKRADPSKLLTGARSVISLGKNYYVPVDHQAGTAKISRYAWGEDYHIVIGNMLKRYVGRLSEKFTGKKFMHYCDTGPVMDKAWAQLAGVGWIAKHTNVINQEVGSWIFLAEVVTDLECRYDEPAVDHCGKCRACIDACPTDAIVEPYVLDSNKCISFLTIENRDSRIPDELVSKMDNWVFGCDVCQDVCPWNKKFQKGTNESAFSPREENLNLKAEDVHLMTREDFSARFRQSPVKRAKFEGFQRNARALTHSF